MNTLLPCKICGGQPATVKRGENFSALGSIGAGRTATWRKSVLVHSRVFITAR
jgi:hypothetical protein